MGNNIASYLVYVCDRPGESEIIPNVDGETARKRAEDVARYQRGQVYLCRIIAGGAPIIPPFKIEWKTFDGEPMEVVGLA